MVLHVVPHLWKLKNKNINRLERKDSVTDWKRCRTVVEIKTKMLIDIVHKVCVVFSSFPLGTNIEAVVLRERRVYNCSWFQRFSPRLAMAETL